MTTGNIALGGTLTGSTTITRNGNSFRVVDGNTTFGATVFAPGAEFLGASDSDAGTTTASSGILNLGGAKSAVLSWSNAAGENAVFTASEQILSMSLKDPAFASTNHNVGIYIEHTAHTIKFNGHNTSGSTINTQWQNTDTTDLTGNTHETIATIFNDGDWAWPMYQSSRDNSGTTTPINFIYTDNSGAVLSAPLSLITADWYAENSASPATQPIATGTASIAFGSGAEATNSFMFVAGNNAGNNADSAKNAIFIGQNSGLNDTVDNSVSGSSILIGNNTNTGGFSNSIALGDFAVNTAANQLMVGSTATPITTARFQGALIGTQCTITTGTGIACTSDERLKKDIVDLQSNVLDKLSQIRTVNYSLIGDSSGRVQVGFLAQNLEQYFPELVDTNADGYKSVYYAQITPILTKAIQDLNIKITAIEAISNSLNPGIMQDIKEWFSDINNGITELYSQRSHQKELCIGDVSHGGETCITKADLDALLKNQTTSGTENANPVSSSTHEVVVPDSVSGDVIPLESEAVPAVESNPAETTSTETEVPVDPVI